MKIAEYNEMTRYLIRPANKLSKADKKAIVGDFHKKKEWRILEEEWRKSWISDKNKGN